MYLFFQVILRTPPFLFTRSSFLCVHFLTWQKRLSFVGNQSFTALGRKSGVYLTKKRKKNTRTVVLTEGSWREVCRYWIDGFSYLRIALRVNWSWIFRFVFFFVFSCSFFVCCCLNTSLCMYVWCFFIRKCLMLPRLILHCVCVCVFVCVRVWVYVCLCIFVYNFFFIFVKVVVATTRTMLNLVSIKQEGTCSTWQLFCKTRSLFHDVNAFHLNSSFFLLERFRAGHFTCKNTDRETGANQSVKLNPRLRIEPCTHGFRSGLSPRIFWLQLSADRSVRTYSKREFLLQRFLSFSFLFLLFQKDDQIYDFFLGSRRVSNLYILLI